MRFILGMKGVTIWTDFKKEKTHDYLTESEKVFEKIRPFMV